MKGLKLSLPAICCPKLHRGLQRVSRLTAQKTKGFCWDLDEVDATDSSSVILSWQDNDDSMALSRRLHRSVSRNQMMWSMRPWLDLGLDKLASLRLREFEAGIRCLKYDRSQQCIRWQSRNIVPFTWYGQFFHQVFTRLHLTFSNTTSWQWTTSFGTARQDQTERELPEHHRSNWDIVGIVDRNDPCWFVQLITW